MTNTDIFELFCTNAETRKRTLVGQGLWSAICDSMPDARLVRQKLQIINDSAVVERKIANQWAKLKAERAELEAYADSIAADQSALDADLESYREMEARIAKLEALVAAWDAEAKSKAELPPSPGTVIGAGSADDSADDGDLQAPPSPSEDTDMPQPPVAMDQ